jgi:hypothetical protein
MQYDVRRWAPLHCMLHRVSIRKTRLQPISEGFSTRSTYMDIFTVQLIIQFLYRHA